MDENFIISKISFEAGQKKLYHNNGRKGRFKIKKRLILLILAVFLASGIAYGISFNRIIYPVKIKDAAGDLIKQEQPPSRIISIDPAITEILFAFNLKDKIVGVTRNCDYPPDAKDIQSVGDNRVNVRKVIELKPDLILANLEGQKDDITKLRQIMVIPATGETKPAPVNVFTVDPHSLRDIYNTISVIGTITNKEHAAYSLLQRMKRRVDWVEAKGKKERRLKAIAVTSRRPLTAAGDGTFLHDLLRIAGFYDISPKGKGIYPKMKREEIAIADPDIIVTSKDIARNPKDIYNSRDFRKTSAGRNKRAVSLDTEVFSRPGPRVVDALEEMASFAYGWSVSPESGSEQEEGN